MSLSIRTAQFRSLVLYSCVAAQPNTRTTSANRVNTISDRVSVAARQFPYVCRFGCTAPRVRESTFTSVAIARAMHERKIETNTRALAPTNTCIQYNTEKRLAEHICVVCWCPFCAFICWRNLMMLLVVVHIDTHPCVWWHGFWSTNLWRGLTRWRGK